MPGESGRPWDEDEIEAAADVYLEMLRHELMSQEFVTSAYLRNLEEHLLARSKKSIEFKWCNVSAVPDEMDLPPIEGYVPMPNFQRMLRDAVRQFAVDSWLKCPRSTK